MVKRYLFRQGFTLIELLVVIAIIAILGAILFPVFVSVKENAYLTQCLDNLNQLGRGFHLYMDDNNGTMPDVGFRNPPNWCGCYHQESPRNVYIEKGQIWPYVRNKSLYLCPKDKGVAANHRDLTGVNRKSYPLSYAMNSYLSNVKPESKRFIRASKLMLLIQERRRDPAVSNDSEGINCINDGIFVPNINYNQDIPSNVHRDGTVVLYYDGHVRYGKKSDLIEERNKGYWIAN